MNEQTVPPVMEDAEVPVAATVRWWRRKWVQATIGGVTAAGLIAAAGVPWIVQQARLADYHALIADTQAMAEQEAADLVAWDAATQLYTLQRDAAEAHAAQLVAFGVVSTQILTEDTRALLGDAGKELQDALSVTPHDDAATNTVTVSEESAVPPLQVAYDARRAAEAEAVAGDSADGEVTPASNPKKAATLPLLLDLTVEDAVSLLEVAPSPSKVTVVSDAAVTGEVVEQARNAQASAVKAQEAAAESLEEVQGELDSLSGLVQSSRDAIQTAVLEAPEQAAGLVAQATYASTDWHAKVTAAADAAHAAVEKNASVAELAGLLQGYVDAATGALAQHAELAAEAAAIAAAQSGAGGYTDPTTGQWREVPSQVWADYGGGSSSSGGGGWSGGGSSSSGGSSGGSSSDDGWAAAYALRDWLEANCRWGYVWWGNPDGGGGHCHPEPDLDDGW